MIIGHPGTWQQFQFRPDNKGLNVMEMKSKYLHEQYLFEAQMLNLQQMHQQNMFMNGAGGGGPLPSSEPEPTYTYELRLTFNDTLSTVSGEYGFDVTSFEAWNTSNKFSGLEAEAISVDNNANTIILKSNTDLTQTQIVVSAFAQDTYLIEIEDVHDNYVGSIRATAFFESAVNVVVLNAVNEIQPGRVFKSTTLTRIELNSLTEIGNAVSEIGDFCRCDLSGADIIQFNNLTSIGDYAFERATILNVTSDQFPALTGINDYGFTYSNVEVVNLPGLGLLSEGVFFECALLTEASFDSANIISDFAFKNCQLLNTLNFRTTIPLGNWGTDVFLGVGTEGNAYFTQDQATNQDTNINYLINDVAWEVYYDN
jgi:hypothetical protein